MPDKIKLALGQGATCSGCDIAVLDLDVELLSLFAIADLSFAPLATDIKYADVEAMADGEITICLFHGAIRNSDNAHSARLLRKKSKIMIAYGVCAAFGGIPGLANVTTTEKILQTVFQDTASTVNPEHIRPQTKYVSPQGHTLELPELYDEVLMLSDIVEVDYLIAACPPTREMNMQLLKVVLDFVQGKAPLPPKGTILALPKTMCDECDRTRPEKIIVDEIKSVDYTRIEADKCLLEQGILCLGPATRAGCNAKCMKANMPCRGCMGPTSAVIDQGASMLSAFASLLKTSNAEHLIPEEQIEKLMEKIRDPLGTFYRFTLPKSLLKKVVDDSNKPFTGAPR
ncbi:MAG: hypothetical protein PHC61_08655 [Chitinivibrionales bacterium]|nr:hypothetical protein [Chitinivibrionales bacterium]